MTNITKIIRRGLDLLTLITENNSITWGCFKMRLSYELDGVTYILTTSINGTFVYKPLTGKK